ncbi:MAG: glycosyltransferase family 9 protein [Sulfurospirillaceae bacterium]|nr:glycosyltransferase family 9 protein [Sulfurospirillaceae bacterium]
MQALGDNLISLALLEQLEIKVKILGTSYTQQISHLMENEGRFEIDIVFEDIPAFYDIRKKGMLKATKDFLKLVNYIKDNNIRDIVFEKKDFRSTLIAFFTKANVYYPSHQNRKVYENRKEMIAKTYHQAIILDSYTLKIENPKMIVINPLTRVAVKNIKHSHLKQMIDMLNENDYIIYLIDRENKYKEFKNEVHHYLTNTTLEDMKQLIQQCDLYIGGDSFLIHLAYYLKKNYFMIFYRDNDDFLPPNITEDFYIKAHKCINFQQEIRNKFQRIELMNQ